MHLPFPFDDEHDDVTPDANVALRHALRHAWAQEHHARRMRVNVNAHTRVLPHGDERDFDATIASYPRAFRRVA